MTPLKAKTPATTRRSCKSQPGSTKMVLTTAIGILPRSPNAKKLVRLTRGPLTTVLAHGESALASEVEK